MNNLKELAEAQDNIKPFAYVGGLPMYSYPDYQKLTEIEERARRAYPESEVNLSPIQLQADGMGYKNSGTTRLAGNPLSFFVNRYRKLKANTYEVVTDKRAIKEQPSGSIYKPMLTSAIFAVKGKELEFQKFSKVSDDEFINEFKDNFSDNTMGHIINMLNANAEEVQAGADGTTNGTDLFSDNTDEAPVEEIKKTTTRKKATTKSTDLL